MKALLQQSFFRLLSEYSQRKVSASELTKAVEELAIHVANFSINEQDYSVLYLWLPCPIADAMAFCEDAPGVPSSISMPVLLDNPNISE